MGEILREHFEECFRHFFEMFRIRFPKGSKERRKALKPIANFCNVSVSTVAEWGRDDTRFPSGETLTKIMCWLDLWGYKIIELERMDKTVRGFAELIGFGLVTAIQASDLVQYKNPQNLYDVFRGKSGISEEKKLKMWDVWKQRKEELEERKTEIIKNSSLSSFAVFEQPIPKQVALEPNHISHTTGQRNAVMQILGALLVFFDGGLFSNLLKEEIDNFSQDDLQKILHISTHLSVLGSQLIQKK